MTNPFVNLIKLTCFNLPSRCHILRLVALKLHLFAHKLYFFQIWAWFFHRQKCKQNVHFGKDWQRLLRRILKPETTERKDKRSHGNKTASQRYLASFALQSFCFISIFPLVSALLFWLFGLSCFYSGNQVSPRYFRVFERSFLVSYFNCTSLILMT